MSNYNTAYHDSETLEMYTSPSRRSYHRNSSHSDPEPWQRSVRSFMPPEPYSDEGNSWGRGQRSWKATEMPMSPYIPQAEDRSLPYDQGLVNSGFQMELYNTPYNAEDWQPSNSPQMDDAIVRRRVSRKMSLFPSGVTALGKLGLTEEDIQDEIESEQRDLVKELVAMSKRDRIQAIRDLPMCIEEKKRIRRQVFECKSSKRILQLTCCTDCSEKVSLSFRRCGVTMASARQAMELWRGTMKEIGGKFGTGVLSYFQFLKWLLMFNIFSFLVNFGFITVPQLVNPPERTDSVKFQGLELLTGAGYFQQTVMYYGGYSNKTIGQYNMRLAFFFTIAAYLVLCGASLIFSMARSFRRNFVLSDLASGSAWRLLCSWDFSVVNEKAVRRRRNNLRVQLKESLSEHLQGNFLSTSEKLKNFGIHLGTWLLSTGMAAGSCVAIYFLCQYNLKQISKPEESNRLLKEASTLLLPFVVSLFNFVIPLLYSLINRIEHYSNPRMQIYVIIIRNVLLKMSIIGILCNHWMNNTAGIELECWESLVGQDLYRLMIIDFLFSTLGSVFGEFLHKVIVTRCLPKLGTPEFDIARNVLDLIYAQTLAWIGIYFSPLLPVIQIIKFLIMFYLKKVSLTQNCQPPRRSGRAAQMQTIFMALLFFPSYVGALSIVGYTVWSLKPSANCGPFQGLNTTFEAVSSWIDWIKKEDLPGYSWASWIYNNMIINALFFFLLALIVLVLIYFFWQIIEGRKLLIVLLREQIVNEGKDKAFLLDKLQNLQYRNVPAASSQPVYVHQPKSFHGSQQIEIDYDIAYTSQSGSQDGTPPVSSALVQAMLARRQAEMDESEQTEGDKPSQNQNV